MPDEKENHEDTVENGTIDPSNNEYRHGQNRTDKQENGQGDRSDRKKKKRDKSRSDSASRRQRHSRERDRDSRERKRRDKPKRSRRIARKENDVPKENQESNSLEHLSDLLRRLHDPIIVKRVEAANARNKLPTVDLTRIPWSIHLVEKETETKQSPLPQDERKEAVENDSTETSYPPWSYLELRRKQNTHWATRRLHDGVRLAKESKWKQAEACYKEGLDLVPNHAELQVAYGALYANTGRRREAIRILEKVVRESPGVANAQQYLDAIRNQNTTVSKAPPIRATAAETALRDVLAERAFLADTNESKGTTNDDGTEEKYPMLPLDTEERSRSSKDSSSSDNRKRRKRRSKQHKKSREGRSRKRKHRRRRSPSFSDCSDSCRRLRRHRSPSLSSSQESRDSHNRRPRQQPSPNEKSSPKADGGLEHTNDAGTVPSSRKHNRSPASSVTSLQERRRKHTTPSPINRRSEASDTSSESRSVKRRKRETGSSRGRSRHRKHDERRRHRRHRKHSRRKHKSRHKKKKHRSPSISDSERSSVSRKRRYDKEKQDNDSHPEPPEKVNQQEKPTAVLQQTSNGE